MVIAVLEMMLPRCNEAVTIGALRAFWDATCARPGCAEGGVFQEVGRPETALYIEVWEEATQLTRRSGRIAPLWVLSSVVVLGVEGSATSRRMV
jgi:quinol monooxygenase YgiN